MLPRELVEEARRLGLTEFAAEECYIRHRGDVERARQCVRRKAERVKRVEVLPKPKEGGKKEEKGDGKAQAGRRRMWIVPWQFFAVVATLASAVPFVGLFATTMVYIIATVVALSMRNTVRVKFEPGAVVVDGVRYKMYKVKVTGVELKSMVEEAALVQAIALVDAVKGFLKARNGFYILMHEDADVKSLERLDVLVEEAEEKADFPESEEVKRLIGTYNKALLASVAVVAVLGALLALPSAFLAATVAAGLYAYATRVDSGFYSYGVSKNSGLRMEFQPFTFYHQLVQYYERFGDYYLVVYEKDPDFDKKIMSKSSLMYYISKLLERPGLEAESYMIARALERFRGEIHEEGYQGYVILPAPRDVTVLHFKIGLPKKTLFKSADFVAFTPYFHLPYSPSRGVALGYFLDSDAVYYYDPVEAMKRGVASHVIVTGASGSGKTRFSSYLALATKYLYGARIVALDPHNNVALPGAVVINVDKCGAPASTKADTAMRYVLKETVAMVKGTNAAEVFDVQLAHLFKNAGAGITLGELRELAYEHNATLVYSILSSLVSDAECVIPSDRDVVFTASDVVLEHHALRMAYFLNYYVWNASQVVVRNFSASPDATELRKAFKQPVTVKRIVEAGYSAPLHTVLLVDEAQNFFSNPSELAKNWLQVRKFGLMFILSTQNITYIHPDIINNTSLIVALATGKEPRQLEYAAAVFGMSKKQIERYMFNVRRLREDARVALVTTSQLRTVYILSIPRDFVVNATAKLENCLKNPKCILIKTRQD